MASGGDTRFDDVLMTMAQQSGSIDGLLRAFFSFLHRRTDFYVVQPPQGASMGFPEGKAEDMLLRAFHAFPMKRHLLDSGAQKSKAPKPAASGEPRAAKSQAASAASTASAAPASAPARAPRPAAPRSEPSKAASALDSAQSAVRYTEEGKQVPVGNGGVCPHYWWTQTLTEATAHVPVPEGTTAKEVQVRFAPSTLRVVVEGQPVLEGDLGGKVRPDECVWSLESRRELILSFDKKVHTWWPCVIKGDPEIDTSKVDSTQRVEDYDAETQAAIRKIMFDQRQKAMGLPTSDDLATQEIMDKARDLPGSPFRQGGGGSGAGAAGGDA